MRLSLFQTSNFICHLQPFIQGLETLNTFIFSMLAWIVCKPCTCYLYIVRNRFKPFNEHPPNFVPIHLVSIFCPVSPICSEKFLTSFCSQIAKPIYQSPTISVTLSLYSCRTQGLLFLVTLFSVGWIGSFLFSSFASSLSQGNVNS